MSSFPTPAIERSEKAALGNLDASQEYHARARPKKWVSSDVKHVNIALNALCTGSNHPPATFYDRLVYYLYDPNDKS